MKFRLFLTHMTQAYKGYTRENGVAMVFVITLSTTILLFVTATLAIINSYTLQARREVQKMSMHRAMFSLFDDLKLFFLEIDSGSLPTDTVNYFDLYYPVSNTTATYGATGVFPTTVDNRYRFQVHNRYNGDGTYRGDIRVTNPATNDFVRLRYSIRHTSNREMAPLIQTNFSGDPTTTFAGTDVHTLLGKMAWEDPLANFHNPFLDVGNIASKNSPSSPEAAVIVTADTDSDINLGVKDVVTKAAVPETSSTTTYPGEDGQTYPPPPDKAGIEDSGGNPPKSYDSIYTKAEVSKDGLGALPFLKDLPSEGGGEQTEMKARGDMRLETLDELWRYIADVQTFCPGWPLNLFYTGQFGAVIPTTSFVFPLNLPFTANDFLLIVPPGISLDMKWFGTGVWPNDCNLYINGILTSVIGRGGSFSLTDFTGMALTGAIFIDGGSFSALPSAVFPLTPTATAITPGVTCGYGKFQGLAYVNARPAPFDNPGLRLGQNIQLINLPNFGAVLPMDLRYFAHRLNPDLRDYCPGWPFQKYLRRSGSSLSKISAHFSAYGYETNMR